jgi:hypothetical protein
MEIFFLQRNSEFTDFAEKRNRFTQISSELDTHFKGPEKGYVLQTSVMPKASTSRAAPKHRD